MGIAAAMVWEKGYEDDKVRKAAYVFMLQLFLNVLWSVLFFGLRQPGLAVVEIVLLWLAIIWTIKCFAKVSEPAAWLLLPYLVWVSFASYLNFMVALLNR
jgi:tryptophan-rich sensory protein